MVKKSIFIYDSTKNFSKFIDVAFRDEYQITSCTKKKKLIEFDLKKNDFTFFIINDFDDIINFIWTYNKTKKIYLVTHNKEIKEKLKGDDSIIILNLNLKKTELIQEIKQNMQIC